MYPARKNVGQTIGLLPMIELNQDDDLVNPIGFNYGLWDDVSSISLLHDQDWYHNLAVGSRMFFHKRFSSENWEKEYNAVQAFLNNNDPVNYVTASKGNIDGNKIGSHASIPLGSNRIILSNSPLAPVHLTDVNFAPVISKMGFIEEVSSAGVKSQLLLPAGVGASPPVDELEAVIREQIESALSNMGILDLGKKITLTIHATVDKQNLSHYEKTYIEYCNQQGYKCVDINGNNLGKESLAVAAVRDNRIAYASQPNLLNQFASRRWSDASSNDGDNNNNNNNTSTFKMPRQGSNNED